MQRSPMWIVFGLSMGAGFGWLWLTQPQPLNSRRTLNNAELDRYLMTSTGEVDRRWDSIVIHHTATPRGSVEEYDRYMQTVHDEPLGMGWHFLIGREPTGGTGLIDSGRRWRYQENGRHVSSPYLQTHAIAICMVGDFRKMRPTSEQVKALMSLVASLSENVQHRG